MSFRQNIHCSVNSLVFEGATFEGNEIINWGENFRNREYWLIYRLLAG